MARTVRDAKLDSKDARAKLRVRGKPYFRALAQGLALGYRKGERKRMWLVRRYLGPGKDYDYQPVGEADDFRDADNDKVFTFWQAQERARTITVEAAEKGRIDALGAPVTVATAIEGYLAARGEHGVTRAKGRRQFARSRLTLHVLSDEALTAKPLHELTAEDLKAWRAARFGVGETTVRRIVNDFRAALYAAAAKYRSRLPATLVDEIKAGLAPTAEAPEVGRNQQVLPDSDVRRILSAAKQVDDEARWRGGLFRLVAALAATGARFSQLVRMSVADVQVEQERLIVPASRKGRGKRQRPPLAVRVGSDVIEVLRPALTDRRGSDPLFLRPRWRQERVGVWVERDVQPWRDAAEITAPWALIIAKAGLASDVVPYALRHSSIVRGLRAGLPARLVGALHDTSSEMIEAHYSRFIVNALDDIAKQAIVPLMPAQPTPLRSVR